MKKKSTADLVNQFLEEVWDLDHHLTFLEDIWPLIKLYDVDPEDDWVRKEVGDEDYNNVRLARTVYLISKIAAKHGGKMLTANIQFKNLWLKMEKENLYDEKV